MLNWIKKFLSRVEYRVLEVEGAVKLPELTPELKDSLRVLQSHSGFQYMLTRLKLEQANLKKYLHEGFQLSEQEMHHLQAGIHYTGWLEREIARLTSVPRKVESAISSEDHKLFEEVRSSLDIIQ